MELMKFPHHAIFIEQPEYTLQNHLLFELSTKDNCKVYMQHPIYHSSSDEVKKIVFVQDTKFLAMWKNAPYLQDIHLSSGSEREWRNDNKFHHAERAFRIGRTNPVPLADVSCTEYIKSTPIYEKSFLWFKKLVGYSEEQVTWCSFINGITRTIWLLANGVKQFPVYVYNEKNAILLAKHAGISPSSFYDLTELNLELENLLQEKNLYKPLFWQD
ncbi:MULTISPECIES: plasmid fertility inhibition factor family protein [Pasteurellaceae]|uniref:Uncharacterized protein n=3 Tax=Actinobacillus TaxID=713 RepID=A0A828PYN8_ACTPL|nr:MULTISPECIES: hypothetical protein [Pasteurellaceae]AIJ31174.1 hypothetical protein ASU1_04530 [Actinobacillus suis ATCC 33415]EFL80086.1 hypothetical protein APP6_0567 [Actinobacillus pleuropneumoniae serovar 6 str. Femo]EFM92012.1 hypothetical protein appser6_9200 [Actinobacillus pleuropneumoniae serovar 6 str. Femo]MCQ9628706.1 hypothetical protein [Actinobacillus suis]MCQ9631359.1 hypothetical protein [Actinobacillus suis]